MVTSPALNVNESVSSSHFVFQYIIYPTTLNDFLDHFCFHSLSSTFAIVALIFFSLIDDGVTWLPAIQFCLRVLLGCSDTLNILSHFYFVLMRMTCTFKKLKTRIRIQGLSSCVIEIVKLK